MLMLSRLRHIGKMLLVALLVMSCTSCARWREAKEVIAEADSLLLHKIVTRDTAALNFAINTLDGPLGYIFAKQDLAKAYYFMGRNFYYLNDFSTAADYYMLCDRLNPSDPMYKGRVNSCMGFLCKQDSCFEEALEFYLRANEAFEKSGDERRIANGLVSIAEQYVCLYEYAKADSVLQIASSYDIDSSYYARMVDVKALALYNQQLYDSALVMLLSIKDYPRNIEARCFSYQMIMQIYNLLNEPDTAIKYARYIITNSNNPNYRSNAYYHLINDAKFNNDLEHISLYSCVREDEDRKIQHDAELCAQAALKLKDYLRNPYPFLYLWILGGIAILLGGVSVWIYRRKSEQAIAEKQQMEAELREWKKSIQQKLDRDKEDIMNEKRMIIRNIIMEYADEFAIGKPIWNKEKDVFRLADSCFGFVIYRLKHKYNLRNTELRICLMVLLDFPNKDCIKITSYTEKGFPTIKRRLAEKLGTSASEMRDFLIDFIAKII
jgi:hypothetical protein